jgi:endonuclease G
MSGYNENFLDGYTLPLPKYSPNLKQEIYEGDQLRNDEIADYVHYSVVMNNHIHKRSPAIVAFNINQNKFKNTNRYNNWRTDKRIDEGSQLDNTYYKNNVWDKGHMARRHTAGWGDSPQEAQRAVNETFYYTNACLQHANLNQDEWLALEDWVYSLKLDKDGKITVFMGPLYADFNRNVTPDGHLLVLVPSGFFKIVCFINKQTNELDVRAFIMYQDVEALKDKSGRKRFNNQAYQVTVTQIEQLTGLQFDDAIYEANPLINNPYEDENGDGVPEEFEIARPEDILDKDSSRQTIHDDLVDIFISSAMVNVKGADCGKEWIALINLGGENVNLNDWYLENNSGASRHLTNLTLEPGQSVVIKDIAPITLVNKGDIIKLFNANQERIDWVNYTKRMVQSGKPVVFLSPRDTLA